MFEQILQLQGFPLKKAQNFLDHIQSMDYTSRKKWLEKERWNTFHNHFEHNPFYKQHLKNLLPNKWTDIPPISKKDLQKSLEELITPPYNVKNVYLSSTSGSSGHPFFFAKDKLEHAITWMKIKQLYALHGITLQTKQARFFGIPLDKKGYYKEKFKDLVMNRVRFPVFDLSEVVLEEWLKKFKKIRFELIYGYTSSLVYFAKFCIAKEISIKSICPSLKTCMVTSEVCTEEDRKTLEQGFGVKVINEYGASETGLLAFEYPDHSWHLVDDTVFIEIVDANNQPIKNETVGRVLCTTFNRAMPFIRYEIGDLAAVKQNPKGTELIQLAGRTNDFAQLPSGKIAPGLTFYYISKSLLEKSEGIKEFIIHQTKIDTFLFIINSDQVINDEIRNKIQSKMDEYLEPKLKLEIKMVTHIERSGSGKIKHFYSKLT